MMKKYQKNKSAFVLILGIFIGLIAIITIPFFLGKIIPQYIKLYLSDKQDYNTLIFLYHLILIFFALSIIGLILFYIFAVIPSMRRKNIKTNSIDI
jgi:uncharacterized BrkB/YihY/UPF0761 family membrane protein